MSIVDQICYYLAMKMPECRATQGEMPAEPVRCIAVFGTDLNPNAKGGVRVQILVRGDTSPTMALGDANQVVRLLDGLDGLLHVDGHYVVNIQIENGPAHIGVDQSRNQEYSINIRVFYCDLQEGE